jgi:hypothetical protein
MFATALLNAGFVPVTGQPKQNFAHSFHKNDELDSLRRVHPAIRWPRGGTCSGVHLTGLGTGLQASGKRHANSCVNFYKLSFFSHRFLLKKGRAPPCGEARRREEPRRNRIKI